MLPYEQEIKYAKDQTPMPSKQGCSVILFESKQQNLSPQEQEQLKELKNLADVSFTKTPFATNNRKQTRIYILSALATRIMDIANDRALELLKNEYASTHENIRDRLFAMRKITPITEETRKVMQFIEKQFNKKIDCNNAFMKQISHQQGISTSLRMEQHLQDELDVLNSYYTKIYDAMIKLGVNTDFPKKLTSYSLKQFAHWN